MNEETSEPNVENEIEQTSSEKSVSENIKSRPIWLRAFFMLVIAFIWGISRFVTGAVIVLQFFCVLLTSEPNNNLLKLGAQLAAYSAQIINYLTFNTNERPFPFDLDWPNNQPSE